MDKIRIVLDGLRGDDSIAELCRKEGIAQSLYYVWSKEFMEAGSALVAWPPSSTVATQVVRRIALYAGFVSAICFYIADCVSG